MAMRTGVVFSEKRQIWFQIFCQVFFLCFAEVAHCNFEEIFQQCNCGSPNQSCKTSNNFSGWIPYSPSCISGESMNVKTELSKEVCYTGIPLVVGSCMCYFNYDGVYCQTEWFDDFLYDDQSMFDVSSPETISWEEFSHHVSPHRDIATEKNVLETQFVVISSGKSFVDLQLCTSFCNDTGNSYRFSLSPRSQGGKSRVELTTCFILQSQLTDSTSGSPLITSCPIANLDSNMMHTYKYQFYLPRTNVSASGKYVLTQWHGTSDWNFVKDQNGCIARISNTDRQTLCSNGRCDSGKVYDNQGNDLGLRYQQGGYPPLTFQLRNGFFVVTARSDQRIFIPKGGCSPPQKEGFYRNPNEFRCRQHPQQQHHVLYVLPLEEYTFDTWLNFEWKIKWSEYSSTEMSQHNGKDPGVLLSNAWIRLHINDNLVVDWVGPCGRNDGTRIPYFKIGVYNPTGNPNPIQSYMKGFTHAYKRAADVSSRIEKEKMESLIIREKTNQVFSNFNHLSEDLTFTKTSGTCTLRV